MPPRKGDLMIKKEKYYEHTRNLDASFCNISHIQRLRTGTDGEGISTIVFFQGCPLQCKYCFNRSFMDTKKNGSFFAPEELYQEIKKDGPYFIMTGGGVVFSGGEPLLYSEFIKEFGDYADGEWNIRVETSLNCPWDNIEPLIPVVNQWIIDIKDMNPEIYRFYTGKDNDAVISNLARLVDLVPMESILCRVPQIPGYNDYRDIDESVAWLEDKGIKNIERFTYHMIEGRKDGRL